MASKSDVAVHSPALDVHTLTTPAVPVFRKGLSRVSEQKQEDEVAAMAGGVQAPCTSKRGPHLDAQAGRPEEKGTMSPSAAAWAEMRGVMLESRRSIWVRISRFDGLCRGGDLSRRRREIDRNIDQLLLGSCRLRARGSRLLKQFIQRFVPSTLPTKQLLYQFLVLSYAVLIELRLFSSCLCLVRSSYFQGCSLFNAQSRLNTVSRDVPWPFFPRREIVFRARV